MVQLSVTGSLLSCLAFHPHCLSFPSSPLSIPHKPEHSALWPNSVYISQCIANILASVRDVPHSQNALLPQATVKVTVLHNVPPIHWNYSFFWHSHNTFLFAGFLLLILYGSFMSLLFHSKLLGLERNTTGIY